MFFTAIEFAALPSLNIDASAAFRSRRKIDLQICLYLIEGKFYEGGYNGKKGNYGRWSRGTFEADTAGDTADEAMPFRERQRGRDARQGYGGSDTANDFEKAAAVAILFYESGGGSRLSIISRY